MYNKDRFNNSQSPDTHTNTHVLKKHSEDVPPQNRDKSIT